MTKTNTLSASRNYFLSLTSNSPCLCTRCRKGSAEVLVNFDDLCPLDMWSSDKHDVDTSNMIGVLRNFHICGKDVPRGYWVGTQRQLWHVILFSCIYLKILILGSTIYAWLSASNLFYMRCLMAGMRTSLHEPECPNTTTIGDC